MSFKKNFMILLSVFLFSVCPLRAESPDNTSIYYSKAFGDTFGVVRIELDSDGAQSAIDTIITDGYMYSTPIDGRIAFSQISKSSPRMGACCGNYPNFECDFEIGDGEANYLIVSPSANENLFYCLKASDGHSVIQVVEYDHETGKEKVLTKKAQYFEVSPDGEKIAYFKTNQEGNNSLVMNKVGSEEETTISDNPVSTMEAPFGFIAWSDDSRYLGYRECKNCGTIKIFDIENKQTTAVETEAGDVFSFRLSGRNELISIVNKEFGDIYIYNFEGELENKFEADQEKYGYFTTEFSPDGESMAVIKALTNADNEYVFRILTSDTELDHPEVIYEYEPGAGNMDMPYMLYWTEK
jgi:hypothetical protein